MTAKNDPGSCLLRAVMSFVAIRTRFKCDSDVAVKIEAAVQTTDGEHPECECVPCLLIRVEVKATLASPVAETYRFQCYELSAIPATTAEEKAAFDLMIDVAKAEAQLE